MESTCRKERLFGMRIFIYIMIIIFGFISFMGFVGLCLYGEGINLLVGLIGLFGVVKMSFLLEEKDELP